MRGGRAFSDLDHEDAARVVIINESMVKYWEGRDPIGGEVSFNNGETWSRVVGIVGDVKAYGLDREAVAQVYQPLRQANGLQGRVLVRVTGDPIAAASIIREAVHAVDPDVPIENVRTMAEIRDLSLATPRLTAMLLSVFAALALLVTGTGITGVIATSVSHRTREFGVRMALGAGRASVLTMVLGQGLVLVALGLAVGIAISLALVARSAVVSLRHRANRSADLRPGDHRPAGRRGAGGARSRLACHAGRSNAGAACRLETRFRRLHDGERLANQAGRCPEGELSQCRAHPHAARDASKTHDET